MPTHKHALGKCSSVLPLATNCCRKTRSRDHQIINTSHAVTRRITNRNGPLQPRQKCARVKAKTLTLIATVCLTVRQNCTRKKDQSERPQRGFQIESRLACALGYQSSENSKRRAKRHIAMMAGAGTDKIALHNNELLINMFTGSNVQATSITVMHSMQTGPACSRDSNINSLTKTVPFV